MANEKARDLGWIRRGGGESRRLLRFASSRPYKSANNASARDVTDTARARRSNGRKVHNNTPNAEGRPRHVLMGNADQRSCSRPAGRPSDFAMAKSYAARLERTRQQQRRL